MENTPVQTTGRHRQPRKTSPAATVLRIGAVMCVLLVVGIFAGQSWLHSYIRSEPFRLRTEAALGKAFHANAQLSLPQHSSSSLYVNSLTATGLKADSSRPDTADARFRSVQMQGVRVELDLMAILQRTWRIGSVSMQRLDLNLDRPAVGTAQGADQGGSPASTQVSTARPSASLLSKLLPNRTEIESIKVERADVSKAGATLQKTRLTLKPAGKDWEILAEDGEFTTAALALAKPIELKSANLTVKNGLTVLKNAHLMFASGGQSKVTGHWGADGNSEVHANLENMNIEPFLPTWWQTRFFGNVDGTLNLIQSTGKQTELVALLQLKNGRLDSLPLLSELDAFLGTPRFKTLPIRSGSLKVHRVGDVTELKDIQIDADGMLRIEGSITVREGKLDGALRVGISPSLTQWLPTGRAKVFEENRDGFIWTPVHVSGTTNLPQEDLSKRLVQAAAGALIDSLQNIQKNPQNIPNAVKGALDALKSILPGR
jgi:hypothetical protein